VLCTKQIVHALSDAREICTRSLERPNVIEPRFAVPSSKPRQGYDAEVIAGSGSTPNPADLVKRNLAELILISCQLAGNFGFMLFRNGERKCLIESPSWESRYEHVRKTERILVLVVEPQDRRYRDRFSFEKKVYCSNLAEHLHFDILRKRHPGDPVCSVGEGYFEHYVLATTC
jgi:hypothetical protein